MKFDTLKNALTFFKCQGVFKSTYLFDIQYRFIATFFSISHVQAIHYATSMKVLYYHFP